MDTQLWLALACFIPPCLDMLWRVFVALASLAAFMGSAEEGNFISSPWEGIR